MGRYRKKYEEKTQVPQEKSVCTECNGQGKVKDNDWFNFGTEELLCTFCGVDWDDDVHIDRPEKAGSESSDSGQVARRPQPTGRRNVRCSNIYCDWTGPEPRTDTCPDCQQTGTLVHSMRPALPTLTRANRNDSLSFTNSSEETRSTSPGHNIRRLIALLDDINEA